MRRRRRRRRRRRGNWSTSIRARRRSTRRDWRRRKRSTRRWSRRCRRRRWILRCAFFFPFPHLFDDAHSSFFRCRYSKRRNIDSRLSTAGTRRRQHWSRLRRRRRLTTFVLFSFVSLSLICRSLSPFHDAGPAQGYARSRRYPYRHRLILASLPPILVILVFSLFQHPLYFPLNSRYTCCLSSVVISSSSSPSHLSSSRGEESVSTAGRFHLAAKNPKSRASFHFSLLSLLSCCS
jgi:hypothetical protein